MLRSLFWIVAVAFLVSGNRDLTVEVDGQSIPLFSENNPALETSDRVVESISQLRGFCGRYPGVCETGAVIGDFALRAATAITREAHAALEEKIQTHDVEAIASELPEPDFYEDEFGA